MRPRVLVTGGAGFLASHLCRRLLERGKEVICVDNYYTGTKVNIVDLLSEPYFEAVRHDITFPLYLEVDEIYNLACPASPIHYQADPVQTTKTCVHGTINMLGLAKRVRAKILQASTSEVYGDPEVHPQTEAYWGRTIRSARARATTKASAVPRRSSSTTGVSTPCAFASPASSTPMALECTQTTAGWCRTSWFRRCAAIPSPSSVKANRPAPSVTSTI